MEVKLSIYSSIYVPTHTYGDKLIQVANISLVSGLSLREELKSLGEEAWECLGNPLQELEKTARERGLLLGC